MTHKEKQKLARKMSGRQTGHFNSPEWDSRRDRIADRVKRREERGIKNEQ